MQVCSPPGTRGITLMKLLYGDLDGLDLDRLGLWKWSGHKELIRYCARTG